MKILVGIVFLSLFLGACGVFVQPKPVTTDPPAVTAPAPIDPKVVAPLKPAPKPDGLDIAVQLGSFVCTYGEVLTVRSTAQSPDQFLVLAGKPQKRYLLQRVPSVSGAVRLEGGAGGVVFLQLANKTMLLNIKSSKRLADGCQSARQRVFAEQIESDPNWVPVFR